LGPVKGEECSEISVIKILLTVRGEGHPLNRNVFYVCVLTLNARKFLLRVFVTDVIFDVS
jgi:hypothetical protein